MNLSPWQRVRRQRCTSGSQLSSGGVQAERHDASALWLAPWHPAPHLHIHPSPSPSTHILHMTHRDDSMPSPTPLPPSAPRAQARTSLYYLSRLTLTEETQRGASIVKCSRSSAAPVHLRVLHKWPKCKDILGIFFSKKIKIKGRL